MKKFIIFNLLVLLSVTSFGQQTDPSQPLTRDEYLKKSKSQKVAAWILLGAGAITLASISGGNTSFDALGTLAIGGTIAVLGCIPLFLAAGKNKRKAKAMTASIRMEKTNVIRGYSKAQNYYPAFSVKINFH